MKIINKIIMSIFFVLATAISCAMESSQSNPIEIDKKKSSEWTHYICNGLVTGLSYTVNSLDSLTNTVVNTLSDDAAFKKLGWPLNDQIAQEELKRSQSIYKRHNEMFKNYVNYKEYQEDYDAIYRRAQYCQRVLLALHNDTISNRLDRGKLALHCLQCHSQVLNDFQKTEFLYFVQEEQKKIKKETQHIDQELSNLAIVSPDNEALNQLIKQTIEKQKKK